MAHFVQIVVEKSYTTHFDRDKKLDIRLASVLYFVVVPWCYEAKNSAVW